MTPKVVMRRRSEDDVLKDVLQRFGDVSRDGRLTRELFLEYYRQVGRELDDDVRAHFSFALVFSTLSP
jgi:hypothetical protein